MKSGKKQKSEQVLPEVEEPGAVKQPEVPLSWKSIQHQTKGNSSKKISNDSIETLETKRIPNVFGAGFTKALAREIVRNLSNLGELTTKPFRRVPKPQSKATIGEHPMILDTSVLIDGRIVPMVNSGFIVGTLVIPQIVLGEVQHIADSSDPVRRAKGRRGLEVVDKLKSQKSNREATINIVNDDGEGAKEVDHKLASLAQGWGAKLVTVDFNLAQYARAQGVKVLNVNDLAQALKMAIVPGEELTLKITHEGREREQGVGYLSDGTMIVVDQARALVGQEAMVVITKIHQTPAGQLFFARLR